MLRKAAIANNIHFVDFTDTMTIGTYEEQIKRTAETKEEELEYYGIILFGEWGIVSEITKKKNFRFGNEIPKNLSLIQKIFKKKHRISEIFL